MELTRFINDGNYWHKGLDWLETYWWNCWICMLYSFLHLYPNRFQIVLSFVCFRILQFTVRWYLFGKCTFRTFNYWRFRRNSHRRHPPDSQDIQVIPPNKKWRISNEAVSFLHSVISGLWALYMIMSFHHKITDDMIHWTDTFAVYLVS